MQIEPTESMLAPIGELGNTAGYTGVPSGTASDRSAQIAMKYSRDSLLLGNLADRVYQLLQQDLYLQRERSSNYGRFR